VFPAVLVSRLIAFWLPIPPGIVAFLQLRRTVARWEEERGTSAVGSDAAESLPGPVPSPAAEGGGGRGASAVGADAAESLPGPVPSRDAEGGEPAGTPIQYFRK